MWLSFYEHLKQDYGLLSTNTSTSRHQASSMRIAERLLDVVSDATLDEQVGHVMDILQLNRAVRYR